MPLPVQATPRQVLNRRHPTMLLRNNVIDLKGQWINILSHMTIIAAIARKSPKLADQRLPHASLDLLNVRRAFDWKIPTVCPTRM